MTPQEVAQTTLLRLEDWGEQLTLRHSLPMFLLGVGCDWAEGRLHVCIAPDVDARRLAAVLREAADRLDMLDGKGSES